MLSVDCRYFKENSNTIRLYRVDLLPRRMPNSVQMYHTFCLSSHPHTSFTFAFRCKPGLMLRLNWRIYRNRYSLVSKGVVQVSLILCTFVWPFLIFFHSSRIFINFLQLFVFFRILRKFTLNFNKVSWSWIKFYL